MAPYVVNPFSFFLKQHLNQQAGQNNGEGKPVTAKTTPE